MKKMPILLLFLALVTNACASFSTVQPTSPPDPTATPTPQYKILFIGNYVLLANQSVHYHMKMLAESADPPFVIEAALVGSGTHTLETLWKRTNARETIREGDFDMVVLQGDIDESLSVDPFYEYAPKFIAEIREVGAEPVLFMAWESTRHGWISMEEIAQAHRVIATELEVKVAPVGLAWQRAIEERPDLDLRASVRENASIYGTYLATSVVFATLFDRSPIGIAYLPEYHSDFSEEEATFLQQVAWETTQEYQSQQ